MSHTEPDFAVSIAEVIKEESAGGAACGWRACSGCHETNEGYETGRYPYSTMFGCHVGSGCSECGGIGVTWEYWSESDLSAMMQDPPVVDYADLPAAQQEAAERLAGTRVVKPLEWEKTEDRYRGSFRREKWRAPTGFGNYIISRSEDGDRPEEYYLYADFPLKAIYYLTLEDAVSAAQADYERRILSALAEPAGEVEPDGLRQWREDQLERVRNWSPPASAIREALEAALETMKRYRRAGHGDDVFMSDLCQSIRKAEATLAGSAE